MLTKKQDKGKHLLPWKKPNPGRQQVEERGCSKECLCLLWCFLLTREAARRCPQVRGKSTVGPRLSLGEKEM